MGRRRGSRFAGAAAAAALMACVWSGPASAAVQVGQTFAPEAYCNGTWIQSISPDDQYIVPHDGVITSWSHMASETAGGVALKIFRREGLSQFAAVAQSAARHPTPSVLNHFPERIAVERGDIVGAGFYPTVRCMVGRPSAYGTHSLPNDVGVGTTTDFQGPAGWQIDIAATLERDADCDGLGDESQDAAVAAVCPTLATTITRHPKRRTTKRRARFEFESSETAAEFECSLDGASFSPCASPLKVRVTRGPHTMEVRATESGGRTGAPDSYRWRVKKRR